MATTTSYPASEKQLAFIKSLATDRSYPIAGKDHQEATILERIFDVLGGKPVAKHEASAAIDYLLKQPKVSTGKTPSTLDKIPASKYALDFDGATRFYEVVVRKNGARYLNALVGAPGAWAWRQMNPSERATVIERLAADPLAAAKHYGERFTCCAKCGSPLSDPFSVANMIGPVCIKSF